VDFKSINIVDQKILDLIAKEIKQNIIEKNESGLDVFGQAHKAYSTNPINIQTEYGLKGGKMRKLGQRAQRRNQLSGFEKAFVDSGGLGRKGVGSGKFRSNTLKKIRDVKVFVPAPSTKDANGNQMPFKHYPGGYKQYKQEVFGSSIVNHKNTGRMMKSIKAQAKSGKKAKVFVSKRNEARAGARNQGEFGRHWFGIGDKRTRIMRMIRSNISFKKRFFGALRQSGLKKISGQGK
jgi:hypothetical protein